MRAVAPTLTVTASDTLHQYAHRDSLHRLASKRDLDSIARDPHLTGRSLSAIARLRAREDSLVMAVAVTDTSVVVVTTPPPAPAPAPACSLVSDLSAHPRSAFAKPGYLVATREPDFGTTFRRITGDPGTSIGNGLGTWPTTAAQHYSKDEPWSADGRLIVLSRFSPALSFQYLFLDGATYQPLFGRNVPGPDARWHPTKPDTMIYITGSGGAGYWDVRRNTSALRVAPAGYSSASMGSSEGNPSYDGRYVAILATRSDGKRVAYALDLVAGTKGVDIDLAASGASTVDWASVSAGGKYIVAAVNDRQTFVYDRATGTVIQKQTATLFGHADLGIDALGAEVIWGGVGSAANGKTFTSIALSGGATFVTTPPATYNMHASTRADLRRGWGYGVVNTSTGSSLDGELLSARLSSPMTLERWGRHRSTAATYAAEPHAVPNHDGTKFMFASDWGGSSIQTYVASCP